MENPDKELSVPICVDKPSGLSSAAVVAKVKKHFKLAKVGHAGTLDPNATGVLILLTNKACKRQDSFMGGKKRYSGEFLFGVTTSTDDIWGEEIEKKSFAQIEKILNQNNFLFKESKFLLEEKFCGKLLQTPPKVSAIKVGGKRAYKRARSGESFEIKPREVEIFSASYEPYIKDGNFGLVYDIVCSKGTYVRSLARDIGDFLGVGGSACSIRRLMSEPFSIEQSIKLEDLLSKSKKELISVTLGNE